MPDYQYDVFLSYRRSGRGNVRNWVHNHFHPMLVDCLADECADEPTVFIDTEVEVGDHWPSRLEHTLSRSRLLVAVWSPQYFRSAWCMAEWRTMTAREECLGFASVDDPGGLVCPVVFSDGRHFPDEARVRQVRSMKKWGYPRIGFRDAPGYDDLYDSVRDFAVELGERLEKAPPWTAGWPVERPPPHQLPPTDFPDV